MKRAFWISVVSVLALSVTTPALSGVSKSRKHLGIAAYSVKGLDIISSHARAGFDIKDTEGTLAVWGKVFDDHTIVLKIEI